MKQKGTLIIISGPSGVGKKTIIDIIKANNQVNFFFSISMTTREKREGETYGIEYYFVTKEEFKKNIAENNLLEWAEFAGNLYGTPIRQMQEKLNQGDNVLLEIEFQGAIQVMEKLKDMNYLSIFIVPPSIAELKHRLLKRGTESIEVINSRLSKAENELAQVNNYQHTVINETPEQAAKEIEKIILNHIKHQ